MMNLLTASDTATRKALLDALGTAACIFHFDEYYNFRVVVTNRVFHGEFGDPRELDEVITPEAIDQLSEGVVVGLPVQRVGTIDVRDGDRQPIAQVTQPLQQVWRRSCTR